MTSLTVCVWPPLRSNFVAASASSAGAAVAAARSSEDGSNVNASPGSPPWLIVVILMVALRVLVKTHSIVSPALALIVAVEPPRPLAVGPALVESASVQGMLVGRDPAGAGSG